jgi:hypothetical protein
MLVSNLLGVLGLAAVVVGLGGLTGNWWVSVLTGGLAFLGMAYVGYAFTARAAAQSAAAANTAPGVGQAPAPAAGEPEASLRAA